MDSDDAVLDTLGSMNNATNLELEETGKSNSLPCKALLQLFVRLEDIKLTRIYPRGTVLFAEGQLAGGVYLLRSGRTKASISSAGGKKVILGIQQSGVLLGVNPVLKGLPYDVTVETMECCRVDFVSRADFMKLLDKSETARVGVANTLSNELGDAVNQARSLLLSQSAAEKLGRLLLKWCDELGELRSEGVRLNHGLTHEEISQMICASRETVTRVLAEFRRRRMIRLVGKSIFVSNREALESVAGVEKHFRESKKFACDGRHSQLGEQPDRMSAHSILSLDNFI